MNTLDYGYDCRTRFCHQLTINAPRDFMGQYIVDDGLDWELVFMWCSNNLVDKEWINLAEDNYDIFAFINHADAIRVKLTLQGSNLRSRDLRHEYYPGVYPKT